MSKKKKWTLRSAEGSKESPSVTVCCDIHNMPGVSGAGLKTHLETSVSFIYEAADCRHNELWHHLSFVR